MISRAPGAAAHAHAAHHHEVFIGFRYTAAAGILINEQQLRCTSRDKNVVDRKRI